MRPVAVLAALVVMAAVATGCEDSATRFNRTGLDAYAMRDYARARAAFDEAVSQNPDRGEYYFNRGMAEQALGNLTEAIFNYDMAAKLSPGIVPAFRNASECHLQRGDVAKARDVLVQGTVANPYNGEAFVNLGKFYAGQGDIYNAKLSMAKAVAADPQNPLAHREYGQLLLATGDRAKGTEHLRRSLELAPIQPAVSAQVTQLDPPGSQLPPPKPQTE
jgi:tetratricopeptide (TPR) repeat protein